MRQHMTRKGRLPRRGRTLVLAAILLVALSGCSRAATGGSAVGTQRSDGYLSGESATAAPETAPPETTPPATQAPAPSKPETATPETRPPTTEPTTEPATEAPDTSDRELVTYYEARLEELRQTLMNERLDWYISEFEYKERIDKLLAELEMLEAGKELETTIPVDGETQPAETDKPSPEPIVQPTTPPLPSTSYRYLIRDGRASIQEYLGGGGIVTVPEQIDGYPVVSIADGAFRGRDITAVTLPETVESIGWFAFAGCVSLESVWIPASVQSIAYAAFENCTHLTVLCPPDSYAAEWAASYGLTVLYV